MTSWSPREVRVLGRSLHAVSVCLSQSIYLNVCYKIFVISAFFPTNLAPRLVVPCCDITPLQRARNDGQAYMSGMIWRAPRYGRLLRVAFVLTQVGRPK